MTRTNKVLTTQQPSYLANIIRFRAASRQLQSCGRNLLHKDRTNLAFAGRVVLFHMPHQQSGTVYHQT